MELPPEDILTEAYKLTTGDRNHDYGDCHPDFAKIADLWQSLFGWEVSSVDVARAMICVKLSRSTHSAKRDNWVDIAGYARCAQICDTAENNINDPNEPPF